MSNKKKYRDFCKQELKIPIFQQDWWLDVVCGKENWDVILFEEKNIIKASFVYYKTKKYFLKMILMPKLTQFMGPYIVYPENQKYSKKLSYDKKIFQYIIDNIPKVHFFYQNFPYSIKNWLPFYWNKYKQTTRYTYVIDDVSDLEKVFSNFNTNIRGDIRKAQKKIHIVESDDLIGFYNVSMKTFQRQKMDNPYSFDFIEKIDNKCKSRNVRKIFFAMDENSNIHAVGYLIWDNISAYYLMGGGDPEKRNSGATSLLVWEMIQFTSSLGIKFDFEGSVLEPVEIFFRAFGSIQKPYFEITRSKNRFIKLLFNIYKR